MNADMNARLVRCPRLRRHRHTSYHVQYFHLPLLEAFFTVGYPTQNVERGVSRVSGNPLDNNFVKDSKTHALM